MSKNDITGDNIRSKGNSKEYRDNFDKIFGRSKEDMKDHVEQITDDTPHEVVDEEDNTEHITYLNDEDFDKFLEMLDNPPEPSEKLKEASRKLDEEGY